MRRGALKTLVCPNCLSSLRAEGTFESLEDGTLACTEEGLAFAVRRGVPWLVRPHKEAELRAYAKSYSGVWQREGWGAEQDGYLLNLPHKDTTGRQKSKWRVKARSMKVLLDLVDELRVRRVLDLGAGMGWLSRYLAQRDREVYALDAVLDDVLGLEAAAVYLRDGPYFERVWGEMERPPFRDGFLDAVVCNASLHYARDLGQTLAEIGRVLAPGGSLIVLNSPVHREGASARQAEAAFQDHLFALGAEPTVVERYHHFVRSELEGALEEALGPALEVPFDPGRGFRGVRWLKGLVLRLELASFPIFISTKEG